MHGALPSPRDRIGLKKFPASSTSALPRVKLRVHFLVFYFLAALVPLLAYAHRSIHDKYDPYKCHALLQHGQWLDPPNTHRSQPPFQKWQPDGCMLRTHSSDSISDCLEAGHGHDAVFIGDSTVREIFWATARKVNREVANKQSSEIKEKHADIRFEHEGVTINFFWEPFLNSSRMLQIVDASRQNADSPNRVELPNSKALVVVGGGLWFARQERGLNLYKDAMEKIATPSHKQHHKTISHPPGTNRVYLLPVIPPFYSRLDRDHSATLQRPVVESMNQFVQDLPTIYQSEVLLSFLEMVKGGPQMYQPNGLHVTPAVADVMAEVLVNARCNNLDREYPFSGTCCYEYPESITEIILILIGILGLIFVAGLELESRYFKSAYDQKLEPIRKQLPLLRYALIFWAALVYCWVADRTHLFTKILKQYNNMDFFIFCFGIALAGGLTVQRSSSSSSRDSQAKPVEVDQPFLSRDQTDEWKGWMQALILAYHYTGGSKVLWIYRIIRLLVASYLFMTGYGHAAYFYQKRDFSLKRIVAVNLRLNLLSVLLPWMMGTDYLFYYFAPLVTYWYAVVYVTMRVKSEWNDNLKLFLGKVGAAAVITTVLHTQPFVFDPAFAFINFVFDSNWETREWLFRCSLDQYIVYVGMIVAVLYVRQSQPAPPPPPPQDPIASTSHVTPGKFPLLGEITDTHVYAADAAALLIYIFASTSQTTKQSSNAVHTFVSPLAILAFIHLRNATPTMRNHYSGAFAWLGRISLETFILQYHIWLAGDTKGLLNTGIFGTSGMDVGESIFKSGMGLARWTDCILIGLVFIWVSLHVARATTGITSGTVKLIFG